MFDEAASIIIASLEPGIAQEDSKWFKEPLVEARPLSREFAERALRDGQHVALLHRSALAMEAAQLLAKRLDSCAFRN